MRVYQINCSASGSTGSIAKAIHQYLLDHGEESRFAYGIGTCSMEGTISVSSWLETHIHDQLSKLSGLQGYYSFFHTWYLLRDLERFHPDIVQLHNIHGNYLCLPLLFHFLSRQKCKVIMTLHDCWMFTGKCPHYTDIGCDKWKKECGSCPQLSIYPKSYGLDRTRKCLKDKKKWTEKIGQRFSVITVSQWLKAQAEQSYLSAFPITCIYNGVDLSVFHPAEAAVPYEEQLKNKFVILGVASVWDNRKGLKEFLDLSKQLQEDEIIYLVGLSQDQISHLPSNVIGIERTENRDQLAAVYSKADVLFNASTEETFGLVVAEAMACGTPAIVYNSTACGEVVNKATGVVVPPHDIKAVYQAVNMIRCAQTETCKYCMEDCLEHIKLFFRSTNMVSNYYDYYKRISAPI